MIWAVENVWTLKELAKLENHDFEKENVSMIRKVSV